MEIIYVAVLLFTDALLFILISIIFMRFGFALHRQKLWVVLTATVFVIGTVSVSMLFSNEARFVLRTLQPGTLATLLSFIAAGGVIKQISEKPYVFTTADPLVSEELAIVNLLSENEYQIEFYVSNLSNVTAKEILIQGHLQPGMRALSISAPVFQHIGNDGRLFELHLDSDRSFNPLHPKQRFSFKVKISIEETDLIMPVILGTSAKDLPEVKHTVLFNKNKEQIRFKDLDKQNKAAFRNLPTANLRRKYYDIQRLLSLFLFIITLIPIVFVIINK